MLKIKIIKLHRCNRKGVRDMAPTKVKVKTVKEYRDMQKMLLFHEGEIHEVTEERAKELEAFGCAKPIKTEPAKSGTKQQDT